MLSEASSTHIAFARSSGSEAFRSAQHAHRICTLKRFRGFHRCAHDQPLPVAALHKSVGTQPTTLGCCSAQECGHTTNHSLLLLCTRVWAHNQPLSVAALHKSVGTQPTSRQANPPTTHLCHGHWTQAGVERDGKTLKARTADQSVGTQQGVGAYWGHVFEASAQQGVRTFWGSESAVACGNVGLWVACGNVGVRFACGNVGLRSPAVMWCCPPDRPPGHARRAPCPSLSASIPIHPFHTSHHPH
eukprot:366235-Chlamydomonas_euryale.AAC.2